MKEVFASLVCVFSNGLSSLVCLRMIRLLQLLCLAGVLLQCEGQGLQTCLVHPTYRPAGQCLHITLSICALQKSFS